MERFDITSRAFKDDPFPTLARLRDAGPVVAVKLPIIGRVQLVTTYEAVNDVLRDHSTFVRDARSTGKSKFLDFQWWLTRPFKSVAENMLSKDEPDHRRLRGLVDEAFQRRSVDDMRGRISEVADEILDETCRPAGPNGTIDFLSFSRQFPLAVISELLGLPETDRPRFTRWASGLSTVKSFAGLLMLAPNMYRIGGYFRQQIRQCRREPRDGLLSLLVEVHRAGETLSNDELLAMAFLLLFAGHETTTHLISGGLLTLLDHPRQKSELMSDWSQAGTAVDELLRYNTPVQLTKPRMPVRDMQLHGKTLKRGQYLMPMLASANSDPAKFADPERLDIHRTPNPHLAFGTGIHVCLGLKLARMEAEVAFERVLTRYPDLELAVPRQQVQWTERVGMRALESLPIRLNSKS